MGRIREIPRTAAFAWSPSSVSPRIVTGTKHGAVDADFSNESFLELWDLGLENPDADIELQPTKRLNVDARFNDIAWSEPNSSHSDGIIAGAFGSGAVEFWDAAKLKTDPEGSHISRLSKHSGSVKALKFNPSRPELLATAGAKGDLFITDVNNISGGYKVGSRSEEFDALDWNKMVSHILVTGSGGGFATVWDVKAKKESITLNNYNRKPVSAIAWNPSAATQLVTATSNDQEPLILMWDLRKASAPEKILRGHEQGLLSLSWCKQDPRLLLSCGKDNRTICWNTESGEPFGEFPVVTNYTFEAQWNPIQPDLIAVASFDGKISVQPIQNTNSETETATTSGAPLDGADFFAKAQVNPRGASFSLPVAPRWLERPVSVNFGFGGKLIKVNRTSGSSRTSKISIIASGDDSSIGNSSKRFEDVLQSGDLGSYCESKIKDATADEEKADWTVIETLVSRSRQKLVEYLGFSKADTGPNGEATTLELPDKAEMPDDSSFFDNAAPADEFLTGISSNKDFKSDNPFKVYSGQESEADRQITEALILGKFDAALDVCLKENRMSDAFMIAICGGQKCIDKAQSAYFKRCSQGPSYLRFLAGVVGKNLWDVAHNADLGNWKEAMAALCSYATDEDFPDLCEVLGDRLEASTEQSARKDASFCYLAGSKLEKVVGIWAKKLQESERAAVQKDSEGSTYFSIHAAALQDFIEKVTIFRQVTKFQDDELSKTDGWKLSPLYSKYAEYADIVAAEGQLDIAERYLDLLPASFPAAEVAKNRVKQATRKAAPTNEKQTVSSGAAARVQRVVPNYTSTTAPTIPAAQRAPTGYGANPSAPVPQPSYNATSSRTYTPAGGYQPPQQGYQPPSSTYAPPQPAYGMGNQGFGPMPSAPPPRVSSNSPAVPPASKVSNIGAWNDTPDFGPPKPSSRRGTPLIVSGPVASPYNNQAQGIPPPPVAPYSTQQRSTPPVGPPPKAGAQRAPSATSPIHTYIGGQIERPSSTSSAANAYAPQPSTQPSTTAFQAPMIPRGPSPYNPPPSNAPQGNRYAPAPGSNSTAPQSGIGMAPPRGGAPPPASSNYAPSPYSRPTPPVGGIAPPPAQGMPRQTPPPGPPPPGPPPKGAGPPRASQPPLATSTAGGRANELPPPQPSGSRPGSSAGQKFPAVPPKYPSGDRSHIPPSSQPIYEVLENEMQRVKARAPQGFKPQVLDAEKRLGILFDHLNNEMMLSHETLDQLGQLSSALGSQQHEQAMQIFKDLIATKSEEGSNWLVGVKRLIVMSKATPY